MSDIVIVSGARTPMGGFQGSLSSIAAVDLGAAAIRAAVERSGIAPADVQEVIMGCVLPAGLKQGPARQASLNAGLPAATGCTTINKLCGSGMKAVMMAFDSLKAGSNTVMIAGGMESMSNAPYIMAKARAGLRMGHGEIKDHMFLDGLEDARTGRLMGSFAQETADQYGITRISSRKKWLFMGLAGVLAALLVSSSATLSYRAQSVVTETQSFLSGSTNGSVQHMKTSTGARLAMWQLSAEQINQRPLIGSGTGSYRHIAKQAFPDSALCGIACVHPHNQFLFFGVEYGLLGIAAYLFYFYRPYRFASALGAPHKALLLGFLGIFFVDSMVHGALWLAVESHFFTFMMALFMATATAQKPTAAQSP